MSDCCLFHSTGGHAQDPHGRDSAKDTYQVENVEEYLIECAEHDARLLPSTPAPSVPESVRGRTQHAAVLDEENFFPAEPGKPEPKPPFATYWYVKGKIQPRFEGDPAHQVYLAGFRKTHTSGGLTPMFTRDKGLAVGILSPGARKAGKKALKDAGYDHVVAVRVTVRAVPRRLPAAQTTISP